MSDGWSTIGPVLGPALVSQGSLASLLCCFKHHPCCNYHERCVPLGGGDVFRGNIGSPVSSWPTIVLASFGFLLGPSVCDSPRQSQVMLHVRRVPPSSGLQDAPSPPPHRTSKHKKEAFPTPVIQQTKTKRSMAFPIDSAGFGGELPGGAGGRGTAGKSGHRSGALRGGPGFGAAGGLSPRARREVGEGEVRQSRSSVGGGEGLSTFGRSCQPKESPPFPATQADLDANQPLGF